jgi:hypothetical protein
MNSIYESANQVVIGLGKYHELEHELVKFDINRAQLLRGHT